MNDVVAGIDFSETSQPVAREGARLADALGGTLHLVHVAAGEPELVGYDHDEVSPLTPHERAGEIRQEDRDLAALADEVGVTYPQLEVVPAVVVGDLAEQLRETAARTGSSLIVVGSHGHGGLRHALLGSVTSELVKSSPVPVVVIPHGAGRPGD